MAHVTSDLQSSYAVPAPKYLALSRIGPYFRDWRVSSACALLVQFIITGLCHSLPLWIGVASTTTCCDLRQLLFLVLILALTLCSMCLSYLVGRFIIFRPWVVFLSMAAGWFAAYTIVGYPIALRSAVPHTEFISGAVAGLTGFLCINIVQFLIGRGQSAEGFIRYLRRELPPTTFSRLTSDLQSEADNAGIRRVPSNRDTNRSRGMGWGAWITCWTVALLLIAAFLLAYGAIPTGSIHVTKMSDSQLVILKTNRILFTEWIIVTWLVIAVLPRIMLCSRGTWVSVSSSEAISHRHFGTMIVALWATPGLLLSGFAVADEIKRALWLLHAQLMPKPISLLTIFNQEHIGALFIHGFQGAAALLCSLAAIIAACFGSRYFMLWLQSGILAIIAAESAVDALVYLNDNREYPRWVGDSPALIVFFSILLLLFGVLAARSRRIAVTIFHQVRPDDPLLSTASEGAKRRLHDFQLARLFAKLPESSQQMFFDSAHQNKVRAAADESNCYRPNA